MRLLLAEDEEDLSRALVTVLKHNNYSVDAVYDGAEALDYLENGGNYDGVILDIMMPKMDGITVLKTIRRHGNSVPVLLLTAKAEIDDRVEGLDSGADDYLPKPFSMKELLARIRAMTRRQTDTTDNVLTFVLGLVESARTAGARLYLRMASDSAVSSVMSYYNRNLWDRYQLLFLEYESEAAIKETFGRYLDFYLEQSNMYRHSQK